MNVQVLVARGRIINKYNIQWMGCFITSLNVVDILFWTKKNLNRCWPVASVNPATMSSYYVTDKFKYEHLFHNFKCRFSLQRSKKSFQTERTRILESTKEMINRMLSIVTKENHLFHLPFKLISVGKKQSNVFSAF